MIGSASSTEPPSPTVATAWFELEDRDMPPDLDAFQVEPGDEPVVGKAEGEPGFVVEWGHPAFFLNRISASLSRLVMALIVASRFKAELRLGCVSCQTRLVGRRLRV
jgi:hypothetical protein